MNKQRIKTKIRFANIVSLLLMIVWAWMLLNPTLLPVPWMRNLRIAALVVVGLLEWYQSILLGQL